MSHRALASALVAAALAGCLYVGGINRAPQAVASVLLDGQPLSGAISRKLWGACRDQQDKRCFGKVCAVGDVCFSEAHAAEYLEDRPLIRVTLDASGTSDEDGDEIGLSWQVVVTDPLDRTWALVKSSTTGEIELVAASGEIDPFVKADVLDKTSRYELVLPGVSAIAAGQSDIFDTLPGKYEARLTARDSEGAQSAASATFEVKNEAPIVTISARTEPWEGKQYVRHLPLVLDVASTTDDDDRRCKRGSKVEWKLTEPQGHPLPLKACQEGMLLDRLQFELAPSDSPTDFSVSVTVTDPWGASGTDEFDFTILADQAPCMVQTLPSFEPQQPGTASKVLVDYEPGSGSGAVFAVTHTHELFKSLDLHYEWQSAAQLGGPYEPFDLQPGHSLTLPASTVAPGESLFLRLLVARDAQAASKIGCSAGEPLCQHAEGLPADCYQWVTWEVVGR